jgi:hypothetical protein
VLVVKKEEKPKLNKKIVFCRMRGGFGDGFAQIQRCYEYAKKYDRKLYIDGSRGGFLDSFNNYFVVSEDVYFERFNDFARYDFSCYPACLENDVVNYKTRWDSNLNRHVHSQSGVPIIFNFSKHYDEDILVHEHHSDGSNAFKVFEWLRLNEKVRTHIVNILEKLGEYDAIHVRNTDYKTDYKTFFEDIKDKLGDKIVLCTDDLQCQLYAKSFFGDKFCIVTELPDTQGKPLHYHSTTNKFAINLATITDLFLLAKAKHLYFSTISPSSSYKHTLSGTFISTFSRLAKDLHEGQDLVQKILYGSEA